MTVDAHRKRARELAAEHVARGDAIGWFEHIYTEAAGDPGKIPWADCCPNPNLTEWLDRENIHGLDRRALVVGCGLGDDAELIAQRGFRVTAFDVAPTAIALCRKRFPGSAVSYAVADVLRPPSEWRRAYDFVLEAYTLQVLPPLPRQQTILNIAETVGPGGMLLIICRARNEEDPKGEMPWPLLRDELRGFEQAGLTAGGIEDFLDRHQDSPVRRFRAVYTRGA
jgi:SAM-dependent methyltransferase